MTSTKATTRTCGACGVTILAKDRIVPEHWVIEPRRGFALVCGACHDRDVDAGQCPLERYEARRGDYFEARLRIELEGR